MNKIRISLVCSGEEEYPGCHDLLTSCPEFRVVARLDALTADGSWYAYTHSDLVLIDERAVVQAEVGAVRRMHEQFPFMKILLVLEKPSRNKTMEALSMGASGVIERDDMVGSIRKAIPLLVAGETWVSRNMVKSLRTQLKYASEDSLFAESVFRSAAHGKLN